MILTAMHDPHPYLFFTVCKQDSWQLKFMRYCFPTSYFVREQPE